jgi:cytoskeletal protein RodZ
MEIDPIEKLFGELKGAFDTAEPAEGHRQSFLAKLEASPEAMATTKRKRFGWKSLSIAAAMLLLCSLGYLFLYTTPSVQQQVSEISPEITNTEFYFTNVVEDQVKKLHKESTPETQKLIADTMIQLRKLDQDYKKMEQDLLNGGNSKLILSAMITNFQTRLDLLNEVMEQIENIKNFKNYKNEHITA